MATGLKLLTDLGNVGSLWLSTDQRVYDEHMSNRLRTDPLVPRNSWLRCQLPSSHSGQHSDIPWQSSVTWSKLQCLATARNGYESVRCEVSGPVNPGRKPSRTLATRQFRCTASMHSLEIPHSSLQAITHRHETHGRWVPMPLRVNVLTAHDLGRRKKVLHQGQHDWKLQPAGSAKLFVTNRRC